jgi:hypothetical protein
MTMTTDASSVDSETTMMLGANVVSTIVDEGAVLLDLESKYFYTVNRSGQAIIAMLEEGVSSRDLLAQCASWGMPEAHRGDVETFLSRLVDDRLIGTAPMAGAASTASLDAAWHAPTIERQREPLQRIMASAFDPSLPLAE